MAEENVDRRTTPIKIKIETELGLRSVSKIQILPVSQNDDANENDPAQTTATANVDKISQAKLEEEKTVNVEVEIDAGVGVDILPAFLHNAERRYTTQDLKYNFLVIYFAAWLKISPYGVDKNGSSSNYPRLTVGHKKGWKNTISFCWFLLALIRVLGCIFSTLNFLLTQDVKKELSRVTLMICLTVMFSLLMYTFYSFIFDTIEHAVPLDNSVFKYLEQEPEKDEKFGVGLGVHTPKELFIIHLPFFVYSMSGMIPLISIFDPSFPLLLVSLAPPESGSRFGFSLGFFSLVLVDTIICTYYIMIIQHIFYLFFGMHRIQEEAGLAIKITMETKTNKDIWKAIKSLRLLHIWTHFYNLSFSNTVYTTKLIALSASIFGGFGLIKMVEVENWPYAGIFGLWLLQGIANYNLCFGAAYKIPKKIEDLKREIRKESFKMYKNNPVERKYVEKYLRSIPWLGVKDGVYKMETLTCANFLEFAVRQITSLVLAY